MRACYFGTYEQKYPRNSVLIEGLRKIGVEVVECHAPLWEKKEHKARLSFIISLLARVPLACWRLTRTFRKLNRRYDFDFIVVGYIGQLDMLATRILAGKKRIIFNPMISLYDTLVNDRKMIKNVVLKKILHWIDKKSCNLADLVVLDTDEHADYFRKEFGLKNVSVLAVGAESIFDPKKVKIKMKDKRKGGQFKVLYYGKYTPLHGTRYVVEAAKILEYDKEIGFEIIGTGQTYKEDMKFAKKLGMKNIKFTDWVEYRRLPEKIAEADICLGGHFGKSEKAVRVVPNKVFQIIAMGKPVVVNNGPAMKHAGFKDNINCVFAGVANPDSIAKAVIKLKNNPELGKNIGIGARRLYAENFSPERIARSLVSMAKKLEQKG